jgi:regulatory protein
MTMRNSEPSEQALFERAGRILALREHLRKELRSKLLHPPKSVAPPAEMVDAVLDRLEELGLLDDSRYARLAAEQLTRKGLSAAGVRSALSARGVAAERIASVLPATEDDDARLAALLRQPAITRKLASERGQRSVVQALLRKGYRHRAIFEALRNVAEIDETDWIEE